MDRKNDNENKIENKESPVLDENGITSYCIYNVR